MNVLITILCAVVVLGFLIFIHEGGHYLAARAFGVRVTEFMIGLPGPSIGFRVGETRFGLTAIPLGGYARVCGMDVERLPEHMPEVLASVYRRGTADMEDVALDCGISGDEAEKALERLVDWGSVVPPKRQDKYNTFRAPETRSSKRKGESAVDSSRSEEGVYAEGQPRDVADPKTLYESEYVRQYCALPFWKRVVILIAGVAVNLVFAMLVFVLVFSVLGFDVQNEVGEIVHVAVSPMQAIGAGFNYIIMVVQAVAGLFNPATAGDTISNSSSVVGIAVLSKSAFEQGLISVLGLMAMLSVSLGVMNLLPIPPLDGGRFVIELIQKIARRPLPSSVINYVSMAGMALFLVFFIVMLNQDVQRFIFGNW